MCGHVKVGEVPNTIVWMLLALVVHRMHLGRRLMVHKDVIRDAL
jgi:hypothetical protein